jgi:hypothetical protein
MRLFNRPLNSPCEEISKGGDLLIDARAVERAAR